MNKAQCTGAPMMPLAPGATVVVYDNLGAGVGQQIGFTEGVEATAPFTEPTPVDAHNAAIIATFSTRRPARRDPEFYFAPCARF